MEFTESDAKAFLEAGLTYDEYLAVVESEKEFEENGITYAHEEVIALSRKDLYPKECSYV